MKFKVSVVIPNFNGRTLLEKSLPAVLKAWENKSNNINEIIIVDDASTDDSVEFLKKNFKTVKIVKHKINRGFSSAVNTGFRSASGSLIALLNNDVFPNSDFLEKVLKDFDDEKVFAVSLHEEGYGPAKGVFRNGFIEHEPVQAKNITTKTFWVSGGSGVYRRDIWVSLGGMDEKLLSPFYWEDIDISYRALKRGYLLLWEPESKVQHKHESTIGKLSKSYVNNIRERNQLIFVWKNLTSTRLFGKHLSGLTTRIVKHPGYLKVVLMALTKLQQIIKSRSMEIKENRISDEAVFESFT